MFKLASLFVDIKADDSALKRQLGDFNKALRITGISMGTAIGGFIHDAIGSATSAVVGFFAKGITGAMNLGESLSKLDAAFGNSASVIKDTADELAKAYGLPKQAILDAGAAIGLVGKGAGQSKEQAASFGSAMAKLAADASSFYNVPLDEALNKIRSGLIGEAEPLRAFGVLLTEEAVAAEAVALGLAKSTHEVDNQAKVAARASLITKGLADATGDLERTQDSTANQFRKFTGSIENLATAIGTQLAPATNEVIGLLNDLTKAITGGPESGEGAFKKLGEAAADAFRLMRVHVRNFGDDFKLVYLGITNPSTWFGKNTAEMDKLAWNILTREAALKNEITNREIAAAAAAAKRAEAQKEAAEAAARELALKKEQQIEGDALKRIADELGRKQQEQLKRQAEAAREAKRHKEEEFRSQTMGVSQFASYLQSQIFGPQDIQKQQLEVQKKTAEKTSIIAEEIVKPRINLAVVA